MFGYLFLYILYDKKALKTDMNQLAAFLFYFGGGLFGLFSLYLAQQESGRIWALGAAVFMGVFLCIGEYFGENAKSI